MNQIIPAILPKSREELVEKLNKLVEAGYSGGIQIDVCDGSFVETRTWPMNEKGDLFDLVDVVEDDQEFHKKLEGFSIELDLMVKNADQYCPLWEMFHPDHIVFHLDSLENNEWLATQFALSFNAFSWLRPEITVFAFSISTDLEKFQYWYQYFNCRKVQVMGIKEIGKQGEPFDSRVIEYIQILKEKYPGIEIQVDGSVNTETIGILESAGATRFICGSSVFSGDVSENIAKLKSLLQ